MAAVVGALIFGRAIERSTEKAEPAQSLLPPNSKLVASRSLPASTGIPAQKVIVWSRALREDPQVLRFGLDIWEAGRRIYKHRAPVNAHAVIFERGDFTGDAHDDLLVFDYVDGSGGCGTYRALATQKARIRQVHVRLLCLDQGSIHLHRHALVFRIGQVKNPRTAYDIHCCFLFLRTTLKRWDGHKLVTIRSSRRPLKRSHPWPPGGSLPGNV
jgi:hypothetical protein